MPLTSFRRIFMIFIFLFVMGAFFCLEGNAQHYLTRTYTEADGLSSSTVFDIVQDSTGMIWLATRSGISSYEGIRFVNYKVENGLYAASYAFFKIDEKGILWAFPYSGALCVSSYQDLNWKNFACDSISKQLHQFTAFDVFYQNGTCVFIAGTDRDGLFVYQDNHWINYSTQDKLPSNLINSIAYDGSSILVATDKGLSAIKNGKVSDRLNRQFHFPSRQILHIEFEKSSDPTQKDKLVVLGEHWLGYIQDSTFTLITDDFYLPSALGGRTCFFYRDKGKGFYFGNIYYIYFFSEETGQISSIGRRNGLISDGGTQAMVDREQNLWITSYRGISRIPSMRFATYSVNEGLFNEEVATAIEVSPGNYMFGHHGVISCLENGKFSYLRLNYQQEKGDHEVRIQDFEKDQEGNIWAAVSALGLARIDPQKQVTWFGPSQGLNGNVTSVVQTAEGNLFVATKEGLYELRNGKFIKHNFRYQGEDEIRKLFVGQQDELFLATYNHGIIELRGDTEITYESGTTRHANNVYSFFTDSHNRRWAGTAAGLYLLSDSEGLIKADTNGFYIHRPVYLILEDDQRRLWFGTDNGVYRWDGTTKAHFAIHEGMSGQEINRDAGFIDHLHHVWFGTNNGVTVFRPEFDYDLQEIPPPCVILLDVSTGEDTLSPHQALILKSDQNNLDFHFRILSYIDERQIFYQCQLEGLDTKWSEEIFVHTDHYRYSNLAPGTYRFCIKARNALGIWSEPVCSAPIRIKQPFWFQWWFICLASVSLLTIMIIAGRLIIMRRYNMRLAKMVAIRTRELKRSEKELKESNTAKDAFFSIIAHDLKSPFNAILGMLELLTSEFDNYSDDEKKKMILTLRTASTRTIDLLENLLTWARSQKGIIPFQPEIFDMNQLIGENLLLFEPIANGKQITLTNLIPGKIDVFADRNMVNTVVRNLLSNAIKFNYPKGNVHIECEKRKRSEIVICIRDNGAGIPDHIQENLFKLEKRTTTRGTNHETGTGLGLILCKEFIEKNQGKIWVVSKTGEGTSFLFSLPSASDAVRKKG